MEPTGSAASPSSGGPPHSREPGGGTGIGAEIAALAAGVVRLEEHAGFTEHTVEQLSAEMAALGKRVQELARRIETIERRIGELASPPEPSSRPARSGGVGAAPIDDEPPPA